MSPITKNQINLFSSLKHKKDREEHQLFVAEGEKVVEEILLRGKNIYAVVALAEWLNSNKNILTNIPTIYEVLPDQLGKISSLKTPNKVLVIMRINNQKTKIQHNVKCLQLLLDEIQDPGNLGTIIRLADWFGIEQIVCSETTADLYNPKVIQSTMGAFLRVPVYYTNLEEYIKNIRKNQQIEVFGAFLKGNNLYQANLNQPALVVMGNESKGISPEIEKLISNKITIPSFSQHSEKSESLNVAIATSIICSEFSRRTL